MVQIDRPSSGQVAVGRPDVDSQAITEESITPSDVPLGDPPEISGFSGEASDAGVSSGPVGAAAPPDWQSERTRRSRQIALVTALSLLGLLSAGVVFGWFVRSWRQGPTDSPTTVAAAPTEDPVSSESSEANDPGNTDPAEIESQQQDNAATPDQGATATLVPSQEDDSPDANLADVDLADATPAEQTSVEATQAGAELDSSLPSDLIPQSPIIDAPLTSPSPTSPSASDPDVGDDASRMSELPPGLEQYIPFLPLPGATEAPTLKAPPTMDDVQLDAAAVDRNAPLVPTTLEPLNLRADLGYKLALAANGYPLADLVLLVSQATGVPIQIDWVSFDLAEIDIDAPVVTPRGWLTARETLDSVVTPLGAELREEEFVLVMTLSDPVFAETLAQITDLSDFGDEKTSAVDVVNQFLHGDSKGRDLQIGPTREDQQRAALACEALRRMRDIAGKVDDVRLARWAQPSIRGAVEWPIVTGGKAGPPLDTPISLAGFLRRMARQNRSSCVVNWFDAGRRATAPQHLLLPHVHQDAGTTLEEALTPLGLQARSTTEGDWWVGSESTYDRLNAIVWTEPLGESRESFEQRLNRTMQNAGQENYRMVVDHQSDRGLIMMPRYIVRQLEKIAPAIVSK